MLTLPFEDSLPRGLTDLLPGLARQGLGARPCGPLDRDFLRALYAGTRESELAQTGWPAEQVQAFLAGQFEHQRRHFETHFPGALFLLLERKGQAIGRLYWWEGEDRAVLVDVILLPALRGQGLGTALLKTLLDRADARCLPIELHVEAGNPARRLYQRLGFMPAADTGFYTPMRRPVPHAAVLHG
ncbi:GNAT family N-acetyltransferase [Mitsuaria sp. WAJ17]|uniref:GNAT family N-acetyltransferase n=1 Tax=Mitsuaria sp. WAJ17 TaxID=2761452 RepID=UPI001602D598|nr:GNAT family N-acetyltransferase [Mitsuaria sp. WAJ17]MBB2483634.1 GNAT family N-acetyltransferase [Mitsuaria sp. WAJ17]